MVFPVDEEESFAETERSIGSLRLSSVRRALVWACCSVWDDDYSRSRRVNNRKRSDLYAPALSRCLPSFSHKRSEEEESGCSISTSNHVLPVQNGSSDNDALLTPEFDHLLSRYPGNISTPNVNLQPREPLTPSGCRFPAGRSLFFCGEPSVLRLFRKMHRPAGFLLLLHSERSGH